ncbi:MAG: hypothetical protein HYT87_13820 [Nitrospirae bacterium]|nr:hypothetical protein [Nitrospirota bacterium]
MAEMTGLSSHSDSHPPVPGRIRSSQGELFRLRDDEWVFRAMVRTAWVGFLGEMANGLENMRERAHSGHEIYHSDE